MAIVNYPAGRVKRLGEKTQDEEVTFLESLTDPGKELGGAYCGINTTEVRCLLISFGNESYTATRSQQRPRGALLNEYVAEIDH